LKKRYEGVYFLSDALKAETLDAARETVRSDIKKVGGVILSEKPLERRAFARPLRKQQGANYWEVTFELDADKVTSLKQRHRLDGNIFRVMIVTAVERSATESAVKEMKPEQKQ